MNQHSIDLLRADLEAARYRVDVLDSLWGSDAAAALFRGRTLPARRALERSRAAGGAETAVEVLARLFVLGERMSAAQLDVAFPQLGVAGAVALGLVREVGPEAAGRVGERIGGAGEGDHADAGAERGPAASGVFTAALDVRPYSFIDSAGAGSWWIVSDLGEGALGRALDEDHVLGVGGASMTLSGLMIPTPVDSVLDLGTGCGIQALHASRHARRVVATDISHRALELAALNARLNGVTSIEFRHGSLFEPVAGERFDRIVSNPPFVITPRVDGVPQYEYRDGGLVGDALVQQVVAGLGAHLEPGGIAQLLGNWEYRVAADGTVDDGLERVRGWVEGGAAAGSAAVDGAAAVDATAAVDAAAGEAAAGEAAVDAWVIERERQDAPTYAETWIRDGGTRPGTPAFDALYAAWLDDFEERGVSEVGFGYLLVRRPAEGAVPTLARYERLEAGLGSNPVGLGGHLARCLDGHDWQAARSDDDLLRATLVHAGDITEERHYWPGADDPVVMTLRQGGGFARSVSLGTALAAFVGACDGDLSGAAICAAIAQVLEVDEVALRAELVPSIRNLLDDAILLPT